MSDANSKQVAGDHYKTPYQHWDMLVGVGYGSEYYAGQVTKYVTRWRKKNGLRDLLKGQHFAQKMRELARDKGKNFLRHSGVSEQDLQALVRVHYDQHLRRFFEVNEVQVAEQAICLTTLFAHDEDDLDGVLSDFDKLIEVARLEARGKADAETPVSRDFEFNGYDEDRIHWTCKKCGCKLNLALTEPPIYAHKQCEPEDTHL